MTDDTVVFTDEEREALCVSEDCAEHAGGDAGCDIPATKAEIEDALGGNAGSAGPLVGDAEPKTATRLVERSEG